MPIFFSTLTPGEVWKAAYDDSTQTLRTSLNAAIVGVQQEVSVDAADDSVVVFQSDGASLHVFVDNFASLSISLPSGSTVTIANSGFTAFQGTNPWVVGGTVTIANPSSAGSTVTIANDSLGVTFGGITFPPNMGPFGITGPVGVTFGGVTVSNFPAVQAVTFPIQETQGITGVVAVTFPPVGVQSVTFPIQQTIGITGSVGITYPVQQAIGVTGIVSVTFPIQEAVGVTGSVGVTFPLQQNIGITGTVGMTFGGVTIVNFPPVQSVTLPIGITVFQGTNPWTASISNFPSVQAVTFPAFMGPVGITGFVGVTFGGASILNFPLVQAVTFTGITILNFPAVQSVTLPIGVTVFQGTTPWAVSQGSSFTAIVTQGSSFSVLVGNLPAVQSVTLPIGLTVFQGTSPWVVSQGSSLTVLVGNFPATQGVTFPIQQAIGITGTVTVQGPSGVAGTPSGGILTIQGTNFGYPIPGAIIDAGNSTSTPLAAGATYTGTWTDVSSYSNLTVVAVTDQVSSTDGFMIQFSTNGTNVDDNDSFTMAANNGQQVSFALPARYYRIVYNNGSTIQGSFRLQSKIHTARPKPSSQRLGSVLNFEQDAEVIVAAPARLSLSAGTATFAIIGLTSALAVAANATRKGLQVINASQNRVSIGIGSSAFLDSGILLYPAGVWNMDEMDFSSAAINVISSGATSRISIQEYFYP